MCGMTAAPVIDSPVLAHGDVMARVGEANLAGDFRTALALLADLPPSDDAHGVLDAVLAQAWAQIHVGALDEAEAALERGRAMAETAGFDDVDRANVLFHLGCVRLARNAVSNAASLLTLSLELADRSGGRCDRLRALILERRARCWQRSRDWEAARADLDRALELAAALGDPRTLAHVYFAASIVAERERQWLLARFYAEEAHGLYVGLDDSRNAAKVLNNLGGLAFLLGDVEEAQQFLAQSFRIAVDAGDDMVAAYAISSLAQVHLRAGEPAVAAQRATRALELLDNRPDHAAEVGNAQIVLGRALAELERWECAEKALLQADVTLSGLSPSHQAAAWMALGELDARRGKHEAATERYRRAAEALQDIHF